MRKISKPEAKKQIQDLFKDIENKSPKEIKKIKRFAMSINFPLKELRKTFCKRCFAPYKNSKIRVKNKTKTIICENCRKTNRWKIK